MCLNWEAEKFYIVGDKIACLSVRNFCGWVPHRVIFSENGLLFNLESSFNLKDSFIIFCYNNKEKYIEILFFCGFFYDIIIFFL